MRISRFLNFFLVFTLLFIGVDNASAKKKKKKRSASKAYVEGISEFYAGNYTNSSVILKDNALRKDKNYALYLLNLGMAQYLAGMYANATGSLIAAKKVMTKEMDIGQAGLQLIKSDARKTYRGDPFEVAMTSVYIAMIAFNQGDYDYARREIKALHEEERFRVIKEYFPFTHYILGLSYEFQDKRDDARIEYEKVVELLPQFPYVYKRLARIYKHNKEMEKAEAAKVKYNEITGDNWEITEPKAELIFFIETGFIPFAKGDAWTGAFKERISRFSSVHDLKVTLEKEKLFGKGYVIADLDKSSKEWHFKEVAKSVGSKLVGSLGRKALNNATFGLSGLFSGGDEADERYWETLPGKIYSVEFDIDDDLQNVKLEYYKVEKIKKKINGKTKYEENEKIFYTDYAYYIPSRSDKPVIITKRLSK